MRDPLPALILRQVRDLLSYVKSSLVNIAKTIYTGFIYLFLTLIKCPLHFLLNISLFAVFLISNLLSVFMLSAKG